MRIISSTSNSVLVMNNCPLFQTVSQMELPMSVEQFNSAYKQWTEGELIQNAFARLNPDQREFIMTGIMPEQWASMFPSDYGKD